MGEDTKETSHSNPDRESVARDPFVLGLHLAKILETKHFCLVGAQGLEPWTR